MSRLRSRCGVSGALLQRGRLITQQMNPPLPSPATLLTLYLGAVCRTQRLELSGAGTLCCRTFELTPTAEAGAVSPVRDDSTTGADRAYSACRSGSGVERGVRPRSRRAYWTKTNPLLRLAAAARVVFISLSLC